MRGAAPESRPEPDVRQTSFADASVTPDPFAPIAVVGRYEPLDSPRVPVR